jgi:light-regulated signal transduction histidine kinase (bacteriophytochrome)
MNDYSELGASELRKLLSGSEARFSNVVESSPDGIIVLDALGFICFANAAAQAMFERDKSDLLGSQFGYPFISNKNTEIQVLRSAGNILSAEMHVVEIEWQGQPAVLATLRDISEHVALEKAMRDANHELERFAYAVSHEIKAPLRNVGTITRWLIDDNAEKFDTEAFTKVELIENNLNRVNNLVDGLLEFALVAGENIDIEKLELGDVLSLAIENLQNDIVESNASIKVSELPSINGNMTQLALVFQNLLSNGMKYNEQKPPKIQVCSHSSVNACLISVTDNGIGIDKKYWAKIFMPFERLHGQSTYLGNGIGLSTCKKIIERHDGTISVKSSSESGSTFLIELPT